MQIYTATQARNRFADIINHVKYHKVVIAIGRRKKCEVLIVPAPEFPEELPITQMNETSASFAFLKDEPNLYSFSDLKKRYV